MAITLVIETGTGITGANSYISLADAETYFEGRLNASVWTAATTANKNIALAQATRTLDANSRWLGTMVDPANQALEWPREEIEIDGAEWPATEIPQAVRNATAELALFLLSSDRTTDPGSAGLKSIGVGDGAVEIEFDNSTEIEALPEAVTSMIWRWISSAGSRSGQRKTSRV